MLRTLLDESQWQQLAAHRSVDFAFTWRDRVRIRGNAYYQGGALAAAFRMLPLRIPISTSWASRSPSTCCSTGIRASSW